MATVCECGASSSEGARRCPRPSLDCSGVDDDRGDRGSSPGPKRRLGVGDARASAVLSWLSATDRKRVAFGITRDPCRHLRSQVVAGSADYEHDGGDFGIEGDAGAQVDHPYLAELAKCRPHGRDSFVASFHPPKSPESGREQGAARLPHTAERPVSTLVTR
jgi:hypothetical protein